MPGRSRFIMIFGVFFMLFTTLLAPWRTVLADSGQFGQREAAELERLLKERLFAKASLAFGRHLDEDKELNRISRIRLYAALLDQRCSRGGSFSASVGQFSRVDCRSVPDRIAEIRLSLLREMVFSYESYLPELRLEVRFDAQEASLFLKELKSGVNGKYLSRLTWFSFPEKWRPTRIGCATLVELSDEHSVVISYWLTLATERKKRMDEERLKAWERELLGLIKQIGAPSPSREVVNDQERKWIPASVPTAGAKEISRGENQAARPKKDRTAERQKPAEVERPKPRGLICVGICTGISEYAYGKLLLVSIRTKTPPPFPLHKWFPGLPNLKGLAFFLFSEIRHESAVPGASRINDWSWDTGLEARTEDLAHFPLAIRVGILGYNVGEALDKQEVSLSRTAGLGGFVGGGLEVWRISKISLEVGVDFVVAKRLGSAQMWVFVGLVP